MGTLWNTNSMKIIERETNKQAQGLETSYLKLECTDYNFVLISQQLTL